MAGNYKAGRQCKVYLYVSSAYAELGISKNPSLGFTRDKGEVTDQSSDYKRYVMGLIDAPLTLELNRKIGDTQYSTLRDAFFDGTAVKLAIASGDMTDAGEEYFEAEWLIDNFPIESPIDGVSTINVTFSLAANSTVTPGFVDVAA